MINWGYVPIGTVIPFMWGSYDGPTGASETLSGLAVTDIEVYKGTSMTQRASDNGYTLLDTDGIDIDGITGANGFSINTGDNSDAGFYAAGSLYTVWVAGVTVDGQTVNFIAGTFGLRSAETTAGVPIVDAAASVWDALRTSHTTVGSFGEVATTSDTAAAVWAAGTRELTSGANIVLVKDTGVTGFNDLSAAGVRSAVGLASANLDTQLGAIDDFIDTEVAAILAAVDTEVAAIKAKTDSLTFTTAGKVDATLNIAGDVAAAVANKIADHVHRRTTANVEASSDGDTLGHRSLYGAIAMARHKRTRAGTNLTIYKSDDSTSLVIDVLTATAGLDPISAVDPPA